MSFSLSCPAASGAGLTFLSGKKSKQKKVTIGRCLFLFPAPLPLARGLLFFLERKVSKRKSRSVKYIFLFSSPLPLRRGFFRSFSFRRKKKNQKESRERSEKQRSFRPRFLWCLSFVVFRRRVFPASANHVPRGTCRSWRTQKAACFT